MVAGSLAERWTDCRTGTAAAETPKCTSRLPRRRPDAAGGTPGSGRGTPSLGADPGAALFGVVPDPWPAAWSSGGNHRPL